MLIGAPGCLSWSIWFIAPSDRASSYGLDALSLVFTIWLASMMGKCSCLYFAMVLVKDPIAEDAETCCFRAYRRDRTE